MIFFSYNICKNGKTLRLILNDSSGRFFRRGKELLTLFLLNPPLFFTSRLLHLQHVDIVIISAFSETTSIRFTWKWLFSWAKCIVRLNLPRWQDPTWYTTWWLLWSDGNICLIWRNVDFWMKLDAILAYLTWQSCQRMRCLRIVLWN